MKPSASAQTGKVAWRQMATLRTGESLSRMAAVVRRRCPDDAHAVHSHCPEAFHIGQICVCRHAHEALRTCLSRKESSHRACCVHRVDSASPGQWCRPVYRGPDARRESRRGIRTPSLAGAVVERVAGPSRPPDCATNAPRARPPSISYQRLQQPRGLYRRVSVLKTPR